LFLLFFWFCRVCICTRELVTVAEFFGREHFWPEILKTEKYCGKIFFAGKMPD